MDTPAPPTPECNFQNCVEGKGRLKHWGLTQPTQQHSFSDCHLGTACVDSLCKKNNNYTSKLHSSYSLNTTRHIFPLESAKKATWLGLRPGRKTGPGFCKVEGEKLQYAVVIANVSWAYSLCGGVGEIEMHSAKRSESFLKMTHGKTCVPSHREFSLPAGKLAMMSDS